MQESSCGTPAGERLEVFVTRANQKTADTVERRLLQNNCLHEIFFGDAIARARVLNEHFKQIGSLVGPLHGIPVSLKDQFHVKGVDTSMGYVGWIDTFEGKRGTGKERNTNSQMVQDLLHLTVRYDAANNALFFLMSVANVVLAR